MGDLAAVAFVIVLLIIASVLIAHFHNKGKGKTRAPGHHVSIWATNPDEAPILIGSARVEDDNFLDRIEMIRSEGRMKQVALNSGRREHPWRLEEHSNE